MYTVGKILRKTRESERLSIEEVAKQLHVRQYYIEALENDDLSVFKSPTYVKGLVKSYCNLLDVSYEKILPFLRRQLQEEDVVITKKLTPIQVKNFQIGFIHLVIASVILLIGVVGFLIVKAYFKTVSAPQLTLLEPKEKYIKTNDSKLVIHGVTEEKAEVYVNDQKIVVNPDFSFKTELNLAQGENNIVVKAVKPYAKDKTTQVTIKAVYSPVKNSTKNKAVTEQNNSTAQVDVSVFADRAWILIRADKNQLDVGIKKEGYKKSFEAKEYFEIITGRPSVTRVTLNGQELKWKNQDGKIYIKCVFKDGWQCDE